MAGINDTTAVLRGGSRDGETTTVSPEITRIVAASQAPGLVDVYEETEEFEAVAGNDAPAVVFRFAGQEAAPPRITAESMHMPSRK